MSGRFPKRFTKVNSFPYHYFAFIFVVLSSIIATETDEITCLLIENKSLINSFMYGTHRRTILHKAAEIGDRRVCDLLIDYGADVNKEDARKRTPLWVAADKGHEDICDVLIQKGAFVDQKDATKKTPLWIAVSRNHEDVCKILIDNGADIFKRDEIGDEVVPRLSHTRIVYLCNKWHIEYGKMSNPFTSFLS